MYRKSVLQDRVIEFDLHVSYDPEDKRASYRFNGERVRRLSKQETPPALSVLLTAAVNELVHFKGYSRRDAIKSILYSAGLDDITSVAKEVV